MNQNFKEGSLAPEIIKLIEARTRDTDVIVNLKAATPMEIIDVADYLNDRTIRLESQIAMKDISGFNSDKIKVSVKYYTAWLRYIYNLLKLDSYALRFNRKETLSEDQSVTEMQEDN